MKNLVFLMMTILLVNISVQANGDMGDRLGESDTDCPFINSDVGSKVVGSDSVDDSQSATSSVISQ